MPSVPALLTATSSRPKRVDGLIDQATDIVLVAHVGEDERGLRAEAAELGLERPAFGLATAGNDDGRALFDESDARWPGRFRSELR